MDERSKALARRRARIEGYLREGKTPGEICDLEGLDPANEPKRIKKEIADPAGLAITPGRNTTPPLGLSDVDPVFRNHLGYAIQLLRDKHHYVEVARMTGLTNAEQQRTLKRPATHNWTLAQMQRTAAAYSMTLDEFIAHCQRPVAPDVLRRVPK